MRKSRTWLLILSMASPYAMLAQNPLLPPSTRIRYSLPASSQPVVAEVLVQRGDSLWVRPERTGDTVAFAVPALSRLDVSLGQHGHALRGAGIGFLTGAVAGAAWGLASGDDKGCPGDSWFCFTYTADQKAVIGGGLLGLIGSGVGAIIGARQKTDRWEPVVLTRVRANTVHLGSAVRTYEAGVRLTIF